MVKVQIIIFDGFDELDAIAPFEVFQSAMAIGADIQVELVTLDGPMEVVAAHGLRVQADAKPEIDQKSPTSGKAGGLRREPLKAACPYHSSLSRNCSIR